MRRVSESLADQGSPYLRPKNWHATAIVGADPRQYYVDR